MQSPKTVKGRIEATTFKSDTKCAMEFFFNNKNCPRFLGIHVSHKDLTVIVEGVKYPVQLRDDHQPFRAPNPQWEAAVLKTPLGDLAVSWGAWGDDPIPPGGIVGTVFLYAKPRSLQLLDIMVDQTGNDLEIRLVPDATHPGDHKTISLQQRKASERIWTIGS